MKVHVLICTYLPDFPHQRSHVVEGVFDTMAKAYLKMLELEKEDKFFESGKIIPMEVQ